MNLVFFKLKFKPFFYFTRDQKYVYLIYLNILHCFKDVLCCLKPLLKPFFIYIL